MEGGFPKKDEFSTKGKQGNAFFSPNLLACVSVSLLNFLSHVFACDYLYYTYMSRDGEFRSNPLSSQDMLVLH